MSVMKFLDIEGLSTFLNQIKSKFVNKENIDSSLSSTSTNPVQNKVINTVLNNKVDKVSGKQLSTNDYTTTEKNKLAGIASGAEVNQNAYANIKVGSTTIAADAKSDTLELVAGTNVTLTPDTTNDKVTITAKDTTYSAATQSTAGLMSATDKKKLDGIASNANNYTHPSTHPASMITQDSTHRFVTDVEKQTYVDKYTKNEIDNKLSSLEKNTDWKEAVETYDDIETTYPSPEDGWTVNVNDNDITYRYDGTKWIAISANSIPLATSSLDGRMSKSDKAKLDGIATGANKYTHPSYTSRTSGLYKVTVDSTGHVSGATAVAKSDITALGIPAQDTTYGAAGSSLGLVKSGGDVTISAGVITVNDDSHAHTIANIDGLQTALNGKSPTTHTHNYAGSSSAGGVANSAAKLSTARTITLGGDLSGSTTFDGSGNVTITATVKDDSHNHTIANVDGLQTALDGKASTSHTHDHANITGMTANRALISNASGVLTESAVTSTELGYLDGVTSAIQTQLNGKAASSHTHSGTQVTGLTASRALVSNSSGQVAVSAVTSTELGYLDGVTSSVQTQLNSKLPQIIGYYGSDASGSNGWYKVCTVSQSGNSDYSINLLFTQSFYRQATGILYVHTRCNNTTKITLQSLKWMYRMGFSAGDVKVVTGTNTWSLYVQQTASQYGRIQVQVLSKSGTSSDTTFTLSSNTTKETTTPGGTAATDGATVNSANSAAKLSVARNIALSGDVTGSVNFDGSANVTLTATVKDDSHNHTIANIDNLQSTLDGKLSTSGTAAKATADASGQNIADTYIKALSVSGRTITYTKGDGGTGTITTQDTTYTHPNSGVTAGTYKSVTVNAQGHVTAGSNPTTLAGYGITDACKLVYQTSEPTSGLIKNMVWIG